jgi:hypothetical protein
MIALLALLACAPKVPGVDGDLRIGPWNRSGGRLMRVAEVAFRPLPAVGEDATWLVQTAPGATWDAGLAQAAGELVGAAAHKSAALTPGAIRRALARSGFPGQARFSRVLTDGAPPVVLLRGIQVALGHGPVDVGLAKREYGDGTVLWVVGFAPHLSDLDPLKRDVALDGGVMLRADLKSAAQARLFVDRPGRSVEEVTITDGVARWVGDFNLPGEYRFEVLADREGVAEVVLLFSLFVETPVPSMPRLQAPSKHPKDPAAAEEELYAALDQLRQDHGLSRVRRFALFEPFAREHSALMGHSGIVAHTIPGTTEGVARRAEKTTHPRAKHHENVAAASSAADAFALVRGSPAHLANLLCDKCSHVAIGVALEPVIDRVPRLFVTWELLDFPQGAPQKIDHYNR